MGDNTVEYWLIAAATSTLWISTNVTKDAHSDCSGTIVGTLLLFTFTKKASTVVNTDVDIITSFHSVMFNSPHNIRVMGLFLQMIVPMDRH